jgi:hypothetical protein
MIIVSSLLLLVAAPLAGGLLRGLPDAFFDFPPLVVSPPVHAPFSWLVFGMLGLLSLLTLGLLIFPDRFGFDRIGAQESMPRGHFPWWGWAGLTLMLPSWIGAWGRFGWMGFMRDHMFFPLWLGYVITMDGLVHVRRGQSLLSRTPYTFLALFPASAISWWYFEYLNRLMENWYYRGIGHFGPWHYILNATLCFSTVFPAIFETEAFLRSFPWFRNAYRYGPVIPRLSRRALIMLMGLGTLGLFILGWLPDPFFYLTWVAPLVILAAMLALAGIPTPFQQLEKGDYTRLFTLGLAALFTGFFWEMWNFHSLPQWNYSVPYVDRWDVFEMPMIGYTGYLPFGPICWCFWLAWCTLFGTHPAFEQDD